MKICLVGNQNSGKTTLFNNLTGMNQKIGNWPGVTIEKKTGIIKETDYELTDLPGIYSLNPYTEEEKVSSQYILEENPDLIINIVDATCLERSLYLTTQLLELDFKVIVVLNMIDMLEKKGITINTKILEEELRTPICKVSALKGTGIKELISKIIQQANCTKCGQCVANFKFKKKYLNKYKVKNNQNLTKQEEEEITQKYNYISKIIQKSTYKKRKWINTTENLDRVFLNKVLSIPLFLAIMFIVYFLSVGIVGKYTSGIMEDIINSLSNMTQKLISTAPKWLQSLIIDGIFKGILSVLSFLPQLAMLYLCISILESIGYMSRVAFMLDGYFRKIGLSGKSLIPFIIGSGCSVPGIMTTKIIENSKQRELTATLVPFVPCSAKLPIIALFTGYFFPKNAGIVSFSFYVIAVAIIIISSIFLNEKKDSSFISELPDYKIPNIKYVFREVYDKTTSFIKRAGTSILLSSIIIWFLLSFSMNFEYGVAVDKSILANIGRKISFAFYPILGVNSWEASVSAIQGIIAKEQVISSMAIISGLEEGHGIFAKDTPFEFFNQASGYAYVIFNLFSAPCFATIIALKKELGSLKKLLFAIAFQTTVAWVLATIFYHVGLLIF